MQRPPGEAQPGEGQGQRDAQRVPPGRYRVPYDSIAGLTHRRAAEVQLAAPPPAVCALSFRHEGSANREDFAAAIRQLGERLLRLKGHVRFPEGLRFVEVAGGRYAETDPLPGARATAFTAIAWTLPRGSVAAAFRAAFGGRDDAATG